MNDLIKITPAEDYRNESLTVEGISKSRFSDDYEDFYVSNFVQVGTRNADPVGLTEAQVTLMVGGHKPYNNVQEYVHLDFTAEQALALAEVLVNRATEAITATRKSREEQPDKWDLGEWVANYRKNTEEV